MFLCTCLLWQRYHNSISTNKHHRFGCLLCSVRSVFVRHTRCFLLLLQRAHSRVVQWFCVLVLGITGIIEHPDFPSSHQELNTVFSIPNLHVIQQATIGCLPACKSYRVSLVLDLGVLPPDVGVFPAPVGVFPGPVGVFPAPVGVFPTVVGVFTLVGVCTGVSLVGVWEDPLFCLVGDTRISVGLSSTCSISSWNKQKTANTIQQTIQMPLKTEKFQMFPWPYYVDHDNFNLQSYKNDFAVS